MLRPVPFIFFIVAVFTIIINCSTHLQKTAAENNTIVDLLMVREIGPDVGSTRPLASPRDVAVNQLGDVFIADYGNDRIIKLDSTLELAGEFGGFGAGKNSLSGPASLALDNVSNVYVVDSGNARILRFDKRLNQISAQTGYTNEGVIEFGRPVSIAVSSQGDIYVGDDWRGACYKFDPFLNYILDFGTRGSAAEIGYPAAIHISTLNKIYVADSENGCIRVFDDFGLPLEVIGRGILEKPVGVFIDRNKGIWISDSQAGALCRFDGRGKETFRWTGPADRPLEGPAGLFITDKNEIYLVDSITNRLFILKPLIGK